MKNVFILIMISTSFSLIAQQPTQEQIRIVEEAKKKVKKMKGQSFPSFDLTTLEGHRFTSEDVKGKFVLFNFWFTRCKPCVEEMPELNELVHTFDKDVLFFAPTFDDSLTVSNFLTRFDFDYQSIPDAKEFCMALDIRSYPTHFIVNPDGIIEKVIIGYSSITVDSLQKSLRKLLSQDY